MCVYVCDNTCVDVKGQLSGVCSLYPLCGSQGLKSGHQSWLQSPLPVGHLTNPSLTPFQAPFSVLNALLPSSKTCSNSHLQRCAIPALPDGETGEWM